MKRENHKMRRRIFRGFLAVMLMLAAVTPAGAETALQINGELEPKTQEETLKMVEDAADAYFRDKEAAAELEKEIKVTRKDVIPPYAEDTAEKLELVIYKRGFESLRFSLMMKMIG